MTWWQIALVVFGVWCYLAGALLNWAIYYGESMPSELETDPRSLICILIFFFWWLITPIGMIIAYVSHRRERKELEVLRDEWERQERGDS